MYSFSNDLMVALLAFWLGISLNLMLGVYRAKGKQFGDGADSKESWLIFAGRYGAPALAAWDAIIGNGLFIAVVGLIVAGLAGGVFIVGMQHGSLPSRKLILGTAVASISAAIVSVLI